MKYPKLLTFILILLSAVSLSLPWLRDESVLILFVGFSPLLLAEEIFRKNGWKHFFLYQYLCFVLWNAFTTFWVCNATLGGGVFAILANALQMSVIFQLFHLSHKRMRGVLPYVFLVAMWIAWERFYFVKAEISWPWLTLGNAFAGNPALVQWYEYTGTLGGSLWIWLCNLCFYALISPSARSAASGLTRTARVAFVSFSILVFFAPQALSVSMYRRLGETPEPAERIKVLLGQPNYDPYEKFESMPQWQQTEGLLSLYEGALAASDNCEEILLVAPETFTGDVFLDRVRSGATWQALTAYLQRHPQADILFGATTYDLSLQRSAPSILARQYGDGWIESHNSAILLGQEERYEVFHKSKLVVGTELTPYPKIFVPIDNFLSPLFGVSSLMSRCKGQDEVSLLHFRDSIPLGCAVCYESVYGEYCTDYVRKGAQALVVITNDAWWGNTPGYRQHCNYSRLRAIETRRAVARCANTGISCFINSRGDIIDPTPWWQPATRSGYVPLSRSRTFFVRYGDVVGRVSVFVFLLLLLYLLLPVNTKK